LVSCSGINNTQVINLPNKQYKIQVSRTVFIPQDNIFGVRMRTQEEEFKKQAQEICPDYKIVTSDSTTGVSKGNVKTWVIECTE
jgi:hypothetical protein